MRILKYAMAWCVIPAVIGGCREDGTSVNACGASGNDEYAESVEFTEYEDTTDCLNGYYIVSRCSGDGVVDAAGGVVVPVSCEGLYFIEDDVIAGFSGGNWRFFSTAGEVIAEVAGAADDAPEMLLEKYELTRRAQDAVWEGIVSGYERFCGGCAAADADFGDMKTVADSLREEISRAEGRMSEGQRRRVEQACREYRTAGEW